MTKQRSHPRRPAVAAAGRQPPPEPREAWIYSPRLHLVLYSLLLVITPLVMLRTFMQQAIAALSRQRFTLSEFEIPVVLAAAIVYVLIVAVRYFRKLTVWYFAAAVIVILMDVIAQQITDYYSAHHFWDLQQNWHYLAYGLFAFMMHRHFSRRGTPTARIILLTFGAALLFSTFDEGFQYFINSRVFDISDIAKDAWGVVAGIIFIQLCLGPPPPLLKDWRNLHHSSVGGYFRHPLTALLLVFVFALTLLYAGSLLSEHVHFFTALGMAVAATLIFGVLLHISANRTVRTSLLILLITAILIQGCFYLQHRRDGVVYNRFGLTVYQGIPVPFFDMLIFADGSFRLVDKKHDFNNRDRMFFLKQEPDILLIGSGAQGLGGNGFPSKEPSQFYYNPFTERGTQIIIQPTPAACEIFNRLQREGKNVLFILHNTC